MKSLHIAIIAGEPSGDQIGAELMIALQKQYSGSIQFLGVGDESMTKAGLDSFFPMSEIAVMGISSVLVKLPKIIQKVYQLVDYIVYSKPDILVIIDSPDFTHPVAKRVHRKLPDLPIINYVSPSVWAWRPGRARKMKSYIKHVMAILPFEPQVYQKLNGPPCTYVGHPIVEKITKIKSSFASSHTRNVSKLLVMPGSRRGEIKRLLPVFGACIGFIKNDIPNLEIDLPALPNLYDMIFEQSRNWPVIPNVIKGESAKFLAFNQCNAALVASGTATLELALWGVPMVVAYKLDVIAKHLKWLGQVDSIVLPNLILRQNSIPEFLDETCKAENLTNAILPLFNKKSEQREMQMNAFEKLQGLCSVAPNHSANLASNKILSFIRNDR